jgi:hypothetical protein
MEGYANAGTLNGSSGNSAPVGGRRHSRRHGKKLRLIKKKTVRRMLAKKGLKMRGGDGEGAAPAADGASTMGGRRRSHRRRHSRKFLGMF